MLDKARDAVNRIGGAYVLAMTLSIIALLVNIFKWDSYVPAGLPSELLFAYISLAYIVYRMWVGSNSSYRTLIATLMIAGIIVDAVHKSKGYSYGQNIYIAIDVLLIIGVAVMYTGPKISDVLRSLRSQPGLHEGS